MPNVDRKNTYKIMIFHHFQPYFIFCLRSQEETSQETSTRMTRSRARQNPGEAIGFQSETFNVTRVICRSFY